MKRFGVCILSATLLAGASAFAQPASNPVIVSASNEPVNRFLVFATSGSLLQSVPTRGQGGVTGNAGGIAVQGNTVAVVNFGSSSVALFERGDSTFVETQL